MSFMVQLVICFFQLQDIPLELLDSILENSSLHWILNSSPCQRDEIVVKSLSSVGFCLFQRMKKIRFRKRIRKRVKGKWISK